MIYNRKEKKYYDVEESKILTFLYKTIIGRILLKLVTQRWVTNLYAKYTRSKISKHKINKFINDNHINMDEYIKEDYRNFDEFFRRQIDFKYRPIDEDPNSLLAPSDSKLLVYKIDKDSHFHIKNSCYTILELLQDEKLSKEYENGYCLVFRLCVDNYHHYGFIDDGEVISSKKIKGKLNTVRPIAHEYCKVFTENKREYTLLKTKHFGDIIQMEVGAIMVGEIVNKPLKTFKRGDEKGYFRYGGSTVILLIKDNQVIIDQDILENSKNNIETEVNIFEKIGRKK